MLARLKLIRSGCISTETEFAQPAPISRATLVRNFSPLDNACWWVKAVSFDVSSQSPNRIPLIGCVLRREFSLTCENRFYFLEFKIGRDRICRAVRCAGELGELGGCSTPGVRGSVHLMNGQSTGMYTGSES